MVSWTKIRLDSARTLETCTGVNDDTYGFLAFQGNRITNGVAEGSRTVGEGDGCFEAIQAARRGAFNIMPVKLVLRAVTWALKTVIG